MEVVQDMVKLQKAIGIDTNFGSSGVYSPTGDPKAILNLGFEHRKRGTITLGSPVSLDDAWIREQLQQVLKDHEPRIEGILQLSSPEPQFNIPQAQYILLRWCASSRINYWLRNIEPRLTGERESADIASFAEQHDNNIYKAFTHIIGAEDVFGLDPENMLNIASLSS